MKTYDVTVLIKFAVTRRVEARNGVARVYNNLVRDPLDKPTLTEFDDRVSDCGYEVEVLDYEEV